MFRIHWRSPAGSRCCAPHVDRVVAVNGIHDHRRVEPLRIGARESSVAVAGPLHRRAHAPAVAEKQIVPHSDLVAVIEDRRAREREQQAGQHFDPAAIVAEQRRQAMTNGQIQAALRLPGIRKIHVVPFLLGDRFERELVVVPEEERPLTAVWNARRLLEHLGDRIPILQMDGQEDARHQREVMGHLRLVAVAEVGANVRWPEIRLRQQHPIRVAAVDVPADRLDDVVRFGKVLTGGALALHQIGHGMQAQSVDAHLEPEIHHVENLSQHRRVVVVEIRLVMAEPVPVKCAFASGSHVQFLFLNRER